MTQGFAEIDWDDLTEYAPAVVTAVTMPLTYSIATGIGLGFITYALCKLLSGKIVGGQARGGGAGGAVRRQVRGCLAHGLSEKSVNFSGSCAKARRSGA